MKADDIINVLDPNKFRCSYCNKWFNISKDKMIKSTNKWLKKYFICLQCSLKR